MTFIHVNLTKINFIYAILNKSMPFDFIMINLKKFYLLIIVFNNEDFFLINLKVENIKVSECFFFFFINRLFFLFGTNNFIYKQH